MVQRILTSSLDGSPAGPRVFLTSHPPLTCHTQPIVYVELAGFIEDRTSWLWAQMVRASGES
jgi:hypothetical protein